MSLRRTFLLAALISMAPTAMVIAQTQPPTDTSPPSSATSPRDTTMPPSHETPPPDTSSTNPSSSSSEHQRTHTASKQSMKDCIAKQQAENSGMSSADAKKACKAQMKGPG